MSENNYDTRRKLAEEIMESWDLDTLASYAVEQLMDNYETNPDSFDEDWKLMFEDED
jgi:2-oxoglutarate dehydrogenase complex dehydrogenase (E1) component-like enzyme